MKKTLLTVLTAVLLVTAIPSSTTAQTGSVDSNRRTELLLQINVLLEQVQALQQQLMGMRVAAVPTKRRILSDQAEYEVSYFNNDFEAVYRVNGASLHPVDDSNVRDIDKTLWQLWRAVAEEDAMGKRVKEFRVTNKPDEWTGAFVELKPGTDDWILGVNRTDYSQQSTDRDQIYQEIFVHEYAHILGFYQPFIVESFTKQFWSDDDFNHQASQQGQSNERARVLREKYYEENINRFASEYATFSPEEDFAETFLEFVLNDQLLNDDEVYQKIAFFQQFSKLKKIRDRMRNSLNL